MNPERKYDVILAPWITEKSTEGSEHNQFTFKVARGSTKVEIKSGIEELFGVTVTRAITWRSCGGASGSLRSTRTTSISSLIPALMIRHRWTSPGLI